jgi:hypothetical protein
MSDPAPGRRAVPSVGSDGITADIRTRVGLVTVMFTGREHARACPAQRAFTYRGRQYAGSVFLTGPGWRASVTLGLSLSPAGTPAGRGVADTIAAIVGTDVAAWLRDHPEILDQAAQARARAEQGRAQRDLELLAAEIMAAGQHLDGLRRKQEQLRVIASGDHPRSLPG